MKIRAVKYLAVFTLPLTAAVAFTSYGWLTFLPVIYAFGFVPLVEVFLQPRPKNLSDSERELVKIDRIYDLLLYLMVPTQYAFVVWFLFAIAENGLTATEITGRIMSLGMLCGVIGINVAHELGHRPKATEQGMAKLLLLSSLYTHFFIEHNRGHHSRVATHDDPATARKNELIYIFWFRSVIMSWVHAWGLENTRLTRAGEKVLSLKNEMIVFTIVQALMVAIIAFAFSLTVAVYFVIAAVMGMLLLETVNYIEHYGLKRNQRENGRFERVMPWHSWNSNHVYGRILLFELTRHSDHHYKASKPYQLLDHMEEAPQLPTGYPGMMLLSLLPPVFFAIMNPKVEKLSLKNH
ncbi:MAG: alkane 1-monooxygenase [Flavobacteriales bacterium]|nr:alkane 1-monooxygenase [Flavobacteriales bacterium]